MNLFDLYAKITLDTDDYERGLDEASSKTTSFGDRLKSGLGAAAKVGAAALTATTAAVAALSKASIDGYADYEQLTGGVETLFRTSADTIMQYAENAYKTAGLSANQYMETVTSFSASLLQGLGGDTEAAARYANMAITDMSDNANKMGTNISMIQNAYQGFAKQNYTMLDNLKLGYGGTASEMARLVNESGVLGDAITVTAESVKNVPFDQLIQAIHVVQDEMGITGTTAKEASTTIQGSVSSMKAAWANLVVGIADENQNMNQLINNFVESVGIAADNILPRVEQILGGIGQLVTKLAPIIAEEIPRVVTTVFPALLTAGTQMLGGIIQGFSEALPALTTAAVDLLDMLSSFIIENLPILADAVLQIITALADGIADALPELVPAVVDILLHIVDIIIENLPLLVQVGVEIIAGLAMGLIQAIPNLIAAIPKVVTALVDGFKSLLGIHSPSTVFAEIGVNLIDGLLLGISETWETIVEFFSTAVEALKSFLADGWESIKQSAVEAWTSIKQSLSDAWEEVKNVWGAAVEFFAGVWNEISAVFSNVKGFFRDAFSSAWNAVKSAWDGAKSFFRETWDGIMGVFDGIVDKFRSIGGNIVDGLKNGISNAWSSFIGWISGKVSGVIDTVMGVLGIHSPSTVFAGIGENMVLGHGAGWDNEYDGVKAKIEDGMHFDAASLDLNTSGLSAGRYGSAAGGDTFNFYSPKALDAVTAAREMKRTKQQLALGYI